MSRQWHCPLRSLQKKVIGNRTMPLLAARRSFCFRQRQDWKWYEGTRTLVNMLRPKRLQYRDSIVSPVRQEKKEYREYKVPNIQTREESTMLSTIYKNARNLPTDSFLISQSITSNPTHPSIYFHNPTTFPHPPEHPQHPRSPFPASHPSHSASSTFLNHHHVQRSHRVVRVLRALGPRVDRTVRRLGELPLHKDGQVGHSRLLSGVLGRFKHLVGASVESARQQWR